MLQFTLRLACECVYSTCVYMMRHFGDKGQFTVLNECWFCLMLCTAVPKSMPEMRGYVIYLLYNI